MKIIKSDETECDDLKDLAPFRDKMKYLYNNL